MRTRHPILHRQSFFSVKRSKSSKTRRREQAPAEPESRASVALTVAWMLTSFCTAAALFVAAPIWLVSRKLGPGGPQNPLAAIALVMLMVAALTGLTSLVLTPFALRIRQIPPPGAITIAAVLIGLAPFLALLIRALSSN